MKTIQFLLKITVIIAIAIGAATFAAHGATTTVNIVGFAFDPVIVTVNVGDTIVWKNGDGEHTVSGVDGDQSQFCGSGLITTCSETFDTAGSFPYQCNIHALCCGMTGLVVVLAPVAPTITTQPLEEMVLEGSTVSFTVAATGSAPLSYQWQLDSTNLTGSGADTTNLVLDDVSLAQAGTYSVIVSNAAGTAVSSNAVLTVQPRSNVAITGQPAALTRVSAGREVTLTATGAGTPPLSYQWMLGGAPIANATNTQYQFEALPSGAITTFVYTVSVSNNFSAAVSSNAEVVVIRAKTSTALTITTPGLLARTTNTLIKGTATSTGGITAVNYWITNINNGAVTALPSATATLGPGGTWSANPPLLPGTNIISAMAVDAFANQSPVAARTFFYKVPSLFTLTIGQEGGSGSVVGTAFVVGDARPGTNNPLLNIGEGYAVTAVPNSQSLFTNWTGTISSTNPLVRFVMEPGMSMQANFVTNFFIGAAGIYNGLFSVSNGVSEQTSGEISGLTLKTGGIVSGKLWLAGASWSIASAFNVEGNATTEIPRGPKLGGPVGLQLSLDWGSTPPLITGWVTGTNGGAWLAGLTAERAGNIKGTTHYTMLMEPDTNAAPDSPPGTGYAAISELNSNVTLVGALADGSPYSQAVTVAANGDVPVYASLYTNTGLLTGWINLPGLAANPSTTTLTWIKPGRSGFTNNLTVVGSVWTNPPTHKAAITLAEGQLSVSNATLLLDFNVTVSNTDAVVKIPGGPTNIFSGAINPANGVFHVTFGNGIGKTTNGGVGAVLQEQNIGAGYFLIKTNAGALNLQ